MNTDQNLRPGVVDIAMLFMNASNGLMLVCVPKETFGTRDNV